MTSATRGEKSDIHHPAAGAMPPDGRLNRAVAWSGFCLGVASGMVMGLWSFDGPLAVPAWIGDYDQTARRFLRMGHIAFFGIGLLNLALASELTRLDLTRRGKRRAAGWMNFANLFLPPALIAAALYPPLKYLLPLPVIAACAALCLAAWGVARPIKFIINRRVQDEQPGNGIAPGDRRMPAPGSR